MSYEKMPPLTRKELKEGRNKTPEKDYPDKKHRLTLTPRQWAEMVQLDSSTGRRPNLVIPEGPHSAVNHPNYLKANPRERDPVATIDNPLGEEWLDKWNELGIEFVDTANRPLHPRAKQLLTAPDLGMFTQLGFHRRYGPAQMGNLGVWRERDGVVEYVVTVVERGGKPTIGLPGGYRDPGDKDIVETALREGFEEAGTPRTRKKLGVKAVHTVISYPKGFKRDTLHAWGEEYFSFVELHDPQASHIPKLHVNDRSERVLEALWMSVEAIETDQRVMQTHRERVLDNEARLGRRRK
jgi:8-oxo-dGTP pyrophosphatase MutT (NUDIX family)